MTSKINKFVLFFLTFVTSSRPRALLHFFLFCGVGFTFFNCLSHLFCCLLLFLCLRCCPHFSFLHGLYAIAVFLLFYEHNRVRFVVNIVSLILTFLLIHLLFSQNKFPINFVSVSLLSSRRYIQGRMVR